MKKKGSVRDVALYGVLAFALAIGFLVINYTMDETVDKMLLNEGLNQTNVTTLSLEAIKSDVTARLDYIIFGCFIAFCLAIIITGFFVGGYPLFVFLYFLVIAVLVGVSAILSNVWETVSQNATLIGSLSAFPITDHILTNFPLYVAIIGCLGVLAMFGKPYLQK